METKICVFEENQITFTLSKDNKMMINATEMAKAFGKDLFQFTKSDNAKLFIEACLKPANAGLLGLKSEEDLIISRQKSGTFMHRVLALKFAAWLSPDFEVWVYSTIESLLFGKHVEREKSFERTISLQKEMDTLKDKQNKTGEDFDRYLEITREINREKQIRSSLTKESINGLQLSFPEDEEE
ncbi:MAG: KilA-N domain-containing protein [Paludibacter sp.]|nr:KilA-N domain-containing protein [Paludibacter sp.]